jgi:multidrug efflux pump subunit AcrA (membrane-fusion protein)
VSAVKPASGRLSKLEMASGLAAWAEIERVYLGVTGKCGELLVKEGDMVEAGQPLLRMDFNRDDAERRLREIGVSRSRLQLDIQNLQQRLDKLTRSAGPEGYDTDTLARDIARAESALADSKALYEVGEISLHALTSAEESLQELRIKQSKAAADFQSDAAALRLDLQAKQLELNNLDLQEEPYRKTLADYESYAVVTAPASGQLISLNAKKGSLMNENLLLAEIGVGREFKIECSVSLDNNFVIPGDTCELSNTSHVLKGTVTGVNPSERGKTVSVTVVSDEITPGETFDIKFEKESATTYTLVPNGALNQDNDGYFVYQVKRRDGMMGKEFYLERINVYIGDNDNNNTAIVRGITFFEPLMLISDKVVEAGDVVKLANVGDFFAD